MKISVFHVIKQKKKNKPLKSICQENMICKKLF